MSEPDPIGVELDDPSFERRGESDVALHAGRGLDDRHRRVRQRRCCEQVLATRGGKRAQTSVDESVQGLRHGQWLTGLDGDTRSTEHPHDLERVERVPAGRPVHLGEKWAWKRNAEAVVDDAVERADVERADLDLMEAIRGQRPP